MANCSGLTDEALETLANSIAASQAQEVDATLPPDPDAAQHGNLSSSDAFGNLRVGSTSRSYIQVRSNVRRTKVICQHSHRPKVRGSQNRRSHRLDLSQCGDPGWQGA